ncbi:MAG TPA: hypothetical protein VGS18_04965 [Thermoplasmata archaeon]|nr:hypothetical protein [Thermoplasmata archaeon]
MGAAPVVASMSPELSSGSKSTVDPRKEAEAALARLGYAKIPPVAADVSPVPEFWVRESGVPRRAFPVFLTPPFGAGRPTRPASGERRPAPSAAPERAILVVPDERAAVEAWASVRNHPDSIVESELAVLVVPSTPGARPAHFHRGIVSRRTILRLATGVAVGLFRRAQASEGSGQIDFEEMLSILKERFQLDVAASLGVRSDEDALFVLYQLAVRDSYAPGDPGASLHLLVLKPMGPAARIPWFAA